MVINNKTPCILPFLSLPTIEDRGLPVFIQLIRIADFQKQTVLNVPGSQLLEKQG